MINLTKIKNLFIIVLLLGISSPSNAMFRFPGTGGFGNGFDDELSNDFNNSFNPPNQ